MNRYIKYALNILAILNLILLGLKDIANIGDSVIYQIITVIVGALSTYLLGNKAMREMGKNND